MVKTYQSYINSARYSVPTNRHLCMTQEKISKNCQLENESLKIEDFFSEKMQSRWNMKASNHSASVLDTGGEPSTWLPPGKLVELSRKIAADTNIFSKEKYVVTL